ncbi:MAG: hypothetical protein P9M15_03860, partial [Candidatus Electryoneaceae bacterium]|nr:hypothetical protein [Candidatus Electryoneaceae bacterium]
MSRIFYPILSLIIVVLIGCDYSTPDAPSAPWEFSPTAPRDLTAQATSPTSIRLTWTDLSTNENGFEIQESIGDPNS